MTVQTKEFPHPVDRVVLFDVDETLIDTSYQVTDRAIYSAVQEAQDAGWLVGLSSDASHELMQRNAQRFGIKDGPLISEKGALLDHRGVLVEPIAGLSEAFLQSRTAIAADLIARGFIVWEGNPRDAVSRRDMGQPGDGVVLINGRRQYSMSYYFRRVAEDGSLQKDEALTDEVVDLMAPLLPDFDDIEHDKNHDYGIYIASRQLVTKRLGTQALMEQMGLTQIAMVGNSITDYVGSDIALHYAVGNAKPAFKDKADYVADAPLTTGAVEILRKLYADS